MRSETLELVRFFLGFRGPRSSVLAEELQLLVRHSRSAARIAEIGVFEGATSRSLAEAMPADGELFLVDPFHLNLRIERLLRLSLYQRVAMKAMRNTKVRVKFVRESSKNAALPPIVPDGLDLVFVDADHSYEALREDFMIWRTKLSNSGRIAFHDSRLHAARPDLLAGSGPVRLLEEIARGLHPGWKVEDSSGTLSVVIAG